jgi:hypothetical protein
VSEGTVKESERKKKEAEGQKRKGRPKGSKNKGIKRKRGEEEEGERNSSEEDEEEEEEDRTGKRQKRRALEVVVPRRKAAAVASGSGWQAQKAAEVDRVRAEVNELVDGELEDVGERSDAMQRQAMEEIVERMEFEIAARQYVCDQLRKQIERIKRKWE